MPQATSQSELLCASCGYDLRTDPRGICPECGASDHDRRQLEAECPRPASTSPAQIGFLIAGWLLLLPLLVGFIIALAFLVFG
jgi:hypothetical protein